MWLKIRSLCNGNLQPETLLLDFEQAAHIAATNVFNNVQIKGCRFHLGQNWFKKLTKFGLKSEYNSDSELGCWLKLFFGLPFCDPTEVSHAFIELIGIAPVNNNALKFSDYVLENYIIEDCSFPPELWAERPSVNPRTTNGPESFHKHLKQELYSAKPNIHMIIEILRKFQSEIYLKLNQSMLKRKTKADENLRAIMAAAEKKKDVISYLNDIRFKCQPVTL